MINYEAIDRTVNWLRNDCPHVDVNGVVVKGFNMLSGIGICDKDAEDNVCGTVLCIAGALVQFSGVKLSTIGFSDLGKELKWGNVYRKAIEILGLNHISHYAADTLHPLFYCHEYTFDTITPELAAELLELVVEEIEHHGDNLTRKQVSTVVKDHLKKNQMHMM